MKLIDTKIADLKKEHQDILYPYIQIIKSIYNKYNAKIFFSGFGITQLFNNSPFNSIKLLLHTDKSCSRTCIDNILKIFSYIKTHTTSTLVIYSGLNNIQICLNKIEYGFEPKKDLLRSENFTISMCAFDDTKFYCEEKYFNDIETKLLIFNYKVDTICTDAIMEMIFYLQNGYKIDYETSRNLLCRFNGYYSEDISYYIDNYIAAHKQESTNEISIKLSKNYKPLIKQKQESVKTEVTPTERTDWRMVWGRLEPEYPDPPPAVVLRE